MIFPLFEKFMLKVDPSFFSKTKIDQDLFLIEKHDELSNDYDNYLYENLFNLKYSNEIELEPYDVFQYNQGACYFNGIGENYFFLNESFGENENQLTFKTLYDYDYDDHHYQERAIMSHNPNKKEIAPYSIRFFARWARVFFKENNRDVFYYLILNSAAYYICNKLEEHSINLINKLIPNNTDWDFEDNLELSIYTNANGREDDLDELKRESHKIVNEAFTQVQERFNSEKYNCVWLKYDNSISHDPSIEIILSDQFVCQKINFDTFQKDIETHSTDDFSILDNIENEFKLIVEKQLMEVYNNL